MVHISAYVNTKINNSLKNHHKSMGVLVFPMKSSILLVRMKTKYLQLMMTRSQKNHMHTIQTIYNMNITHPMSHRSIFLHFPPEPPMYDPIFGNAFDRDTIVYSPETLFCWATIQHQGRSSRCHKSFPHYQSLHVQGVIIKSIKTPSSMCS